VRNARGETQIDQAQPTSQPSSPAQRGYTLPGVGGLRLLGADRSRSGYPTAPSEWRGKSTEDVGFLRRDAAARGANPQEQPHCRFNRLIDWIEDHEFAGAKKRGWFDVLVYQAHLHPRHARVIDYWHDWEARWTNERYPSFSQWSIPPLSGLRATGLGSSARDKFSVLFWRGDSRLAGAVATWQRTLQLGFPDSSGSERPCSPIQGYLCRRATSVRGSVGASLGPSWALERKDHRAPLRALGERKAGADGS